MCVTSASGCRFPVILGGVDFSFSLSSCAKVTKNCIVRGIEFQIIINEKTQMAYFQKERKATSKAKHDNIELLNLIEKCSCIIKT
jgi:hypothetical protein